MIKFGIFASPEWRNAKRFHISIFFSQTMLHFLAIVCTEAPYYNCLQVPSSLIYLLLIEKILELTVVRQPWGCPWAWALLTAGGTRQPLAVGQRFAPPGQAQGRQLRAGPISLRRSRFGTGGTSSFSSQVPRQARGRSCGHSSDRPPPPRGQQSIPPPGKHILLPQLPGKHISVQRPWGGSGRGSRRGTGERVPAPGRPAEPGEGGRDSTARCRGGPGREGGADSGGAAPRPWGGAASRFNKGRAGAPLGVARRTGRGGSGR